MFENIAELQAIIEKPQRTVIMMHHNPDGDTMGSSLALAQICEREGHQTTVVSPTPYPRFLNWMPEKERILLFEKHKEKITKAIDEADVIFCLDFIPLHRVGKMESLVRKSKAMKIAIDHHPDEGEKMDLLFCDLAAPATCLLLYDLLVHMGKESWIDSKIAAALYTGIITDTGCFAHANTTPQVHRLAASLIEKGVDASAVYHAIYGNQSINRMRFLANAIMHRLVVLPTYRTAYFAIPREDFLRFHLQTGDKSGIVNYALNLENIALACLIGEQKTAGEISFSLRSRGNISVSQIAADYFGGGGHKNAAGAIAKMSLSEAKKAFEDMVRREMKTTTNK